MIEQFSNQQTGGTHTHAHKQLMYYILYRYRTAVHTHTHVYCTQKWLPIHSSTCQYCNCAHSTETKQHIHDLSPSSLSLLVPPLPHLIIINKRRERERGGEGEQEGEREISYRIGDQRISNNMFRISHCGHNDSNFIGSLLCVTHIQTHTDSPTHSLSLTQSINQSHSLSQRVNQ